MKRKWIAVALGVALVGAALFMGAPRVLAYGRMGSMMGGSYSMGQMMQNYSTSVPTSDGTGWMNGAEWMNKMHTPEMFEAMKNGTMLEYMNSPEIREQLKDTPMGAMMYSPEMQEFMQSPEMQNLLESDAFKKMQSSPQLQQMVSRGGASCHGSGGFVQGNQAQGQQSSGGY